MLKWFRKYNKFILIIGCAVLMVAFLIPQAVSMFSPKPGARVLGTMAGQEVNERDLARAANELDLLRSLNLPDMLAPYDREQWLMVQHDARRLGLDASAGEINAVLDSVGLDAATLAERARQSNAQVGFFRQTVRHWLVSERYRMLITGRRYGADLAVTESPGLTTLSVWGQEVLPAMQQISQLNDPQTQQASLQKLQVGFMMVRAGQGRISPPAVEYFARNALERVGGRVVILEPAVDETATIDEPQLERLFEEYKAFFPGQGAPYPLGYRQPERVNAEYLHFPADAALDAVTVEPLDVLEFYRQNRDDFAIGDDEAPAMPTDEARTQIEQQLRFKKAGNLMRRALAEARAVLDEDVRALETSANYKILPDGFQPISLEVVADRVASRTGLRPAVATTDGWVSPAELSAAVEGFGAARLPGSGVPVAGYLSFARELHDADKVLPVQVQVGVAGEATVGPDSSVYIPRLTGARPSAIPASLSEVREQVTTDARKIQAYEALADQADALPQRAADEGIDALASSFDAEVAGIAPLPRRDPGAPSRDGRPQPPFVQGVGRSEALIEKIFAIVADVPPGTALLDAATVAQRTVAVPVDRAMAVAVFEATSYQTPTRAAYETIRKQNAFTVNDLPLLGNVPIGRPLESAALAERLGFAPPTDDDEDNAEKSEASDTRS